MAKTSLPTNKLAFILLIALGLLCFVLTFFNSSKQGYQLCELLLEVASLIAEHRFQVQWASAVVAPALQGTRSVVLVHRLCCSGACGVFPGQISNPCPLHWLADSLPPVPPCATNIMAPGPIASWQIDGETVETVADFIFGGSKNHCRW